MKTTNSIKDHLQKLSALPSRYNIMLEQALFSIKDEDEREEICVVACVISSAAWQYWQAWRPPEDNRQEHEWVVFSNAMKIAESEGLNLSEKRIATAFAFTHDTFSIPRIMEQHLREATDEEKKRLNEEKNRQRLQHMKGGAENAEFILRRLKHPDDQAKPLLDDQEIKRCVHIVREHDSWKLNPPSPPPLQDRLALVCLEGDVLWPLHPIGVLADLERPDSKGVSKDLFASPEWRNQLKQSLQTLVHFRGKWGLPDRDFIDKTTIFRTKVGHQLYSEWLDFWNL